MKDIFEIAGEGKTLSDVEIAGALERALGEWEAEKGPVRNALIIPPDFISTCCRATLT